VEKHLAPQTREQIGRENFLEECYRWSANYRQTIETQLKRLCPLFDWSNAYFTMDNNLVEYVCDAFIRLYNDGLIYRDRRIVNWCCQLRSVVSDIEVDSKEILGRQKLSVPGYSKEIELGVLYNIAYKIIDEQEDREIIVSTTRPETILADTGIAVHPNDSRYQLLKDKFVQNPFDPQDRLPIIFDENVDQNFGTGAVKLTPGHDAFDYTLAIKHKLQIRTMLNDQGRVQLHTNHPFYQELNDLHRYDAREKVLQLLANLRLRRGEQEQQKMIVPLCSRTGDIIEPMVKEQWFLDTTEMCKLISINRSMFLYNKRLSSIVGRQASSIVDDDTLKLTPSSTRKVWKYWLNNHRPWCLSRQLWWGHSIPMYRCSRNSNSSEQQWIAAKSLEEAKIKAAQLFPNIPSDSIHVEQDQDVLDTWFSSGLLPISIFHNKNSQEFPTTLLDTGYDIMFFWVARMVMLVNILSNEY
jgi:valyl-tRNA synthetase